jgi:hypothetical protein
LLGKWLFPTTFEREQAELFFVEFVVIFQVALVCLQFVVGIIWDSTCSNETKFLMSLEQNRDQVLKKAIASINGKCSVVGVLSFGVLLLVCCLLVCSLSLCYLFGFVIHR